MTVYPDIFQRPEGRTLRGHDMAVVERRVGLVATAGGWRHWRAGVESRTAATAESVQRSANTSGPNQQPLPRQSRARRPPKPIYIHLTH